MTRRRHLWLLTAAFGLVEAFFDNCTRGPHDNWQGPLSQKGFVFLVDGTSMIPGEVRRIEAGTNHTVELRATGNATFVGFLLRFGHLFRFTEAIAKTCDDLTPVSNNSELYPVCNTEENVAGIINATNTSQTSVVGILNPFFPAEGLAMDVTAEVNDTHSYFNTYVFDVWQHEPSASPTGIPSVQPSLSLTPTVSNEPTTVPTESQKPSLKPSGAPSGQPTRSDFPTISAMPSLQPTNSSFPTISELPSSTPYPTETPQIPDIFRPTVSPAPSNSPSQSPTRTPCTSNLQEILLAEFSDSVNLEEERVYYLCPNLVYRVDVQTAFWPRSNMKVYCGYEGVSSNNCVVMGGDVQILFPISDRVISNVLFQGISFVRSRIYNSVLTKPGSVKFVDCVFRDNYNTGIGLFRFQRFTTAPSLSPAPSESPKPSHAPTITGMPTITHSPTQTFSPTMVNSTAPPKQTQTNESPAQTSPPPPPPPAPPPPPPPTPPTIINSTVLPKQNTTNGTLPKQRLLLDERGLTVIDSSWWERSPEEFSQRLFLPEGEDANDLNITFDGCQFRNNTSNSPVGGLLEMQGSPLMVVNSVFKDNFGVNFLVRTIDEAARLDVKQNCFINNTLEVAPVVTINATIVESEMAFYDGVVMDNRTCPYLAEFLGPNLTSCSDFDLEGCKFTPSPTSPPLAPTAPPSLLPCYRSLEGISRDELAVGENTTLIRTYRLCAHTVFDVDSQSPFFPRSNVRYICGDDGSVTNDCVVSGGDFHILPPFVDDISENVFFQGITFVGARVYTMALVKPGSFLFFQCDFRDNAGEGTALLSPLQSSSTKILPELESLYKNTSSPAQGNQERSLVERIWQGITSISIFRSLQEPGQLSVTFDACGIHNNTSTGATNGLIENEGSLLNLTNCVVSGNYEIDHVINSIGTEAEMELQGNCIVNNVVQIAPVVNREDSSYDADDNAGDGGSDNRTCEFIADFENSTSVDCDRFDDDECALTSMPSFSPTNAPTNVCFDNLLEISNLETSPALNVSEPRIYQLCGNTVYNVDEQAPIAVRPNLQIVCGDDFGSDNQCIISSGEIQVFSSFSDDYAPNVTIQGLTFVGARVHNVGLMKASEVLFLDCVFKDNTNEAVVLTSFFTVTPSPTTSPTMSSEPTFAPTFFPTQPRRLLEGSDMVTGPTPTSPDILSFQKQRMVESYKGISNRFLQEEFPDDQIRLEVAFEDCVFQNNTITMPLSGVVRAEGNWLSITSSLFVANKNADYMVSNIRGFLNVAENCYFDNDVRVAPVLNLANGNFSSDANFGPFDENLLCQYLADIVVEESDVTCVPFEATDGCRVFFTPAPTTTIPPSMSPSSSFRPSNSPSISFMPTTSPMPSASPSLSHQPTTSPRPSSSPTDRPTVSPTLSQAPTVAPTLSFVPSLSLLPSASPTTSANPTSSPAPTTESTPSPTETSFLPPSVTSGPPTTRPPTSRPPTRPPTNRPTLDPASPTTSPSFVPSQVPSPRPTRIPTPPPTPPPAASLSPTGTFPTTSPSFVPSKIPTPRPTKIPTPPPSPGGSRAPSFPPSSNPTTSPMPSEGPSTSFNPTTTPFPTSSLNPSANPTTSNMPTASPSTSSLPTVTEALDNAAAPARKRSNINKRKKKNIFERKKQEQEEDKTT